MVSPTVAVQIAKGVIYYNVIPNHICGPEAAEYFRQGIKEAARKDVESGHYLARVFENADWMSKPWHRRNSRP